MVLISLLVFAATWFLVARRAKSNGAGFFGRNMVGSIIGLVVMFGVVLITPFSDRDSGVVVASGEVDGAVYRITKDESLGTMKRSVEAQIKEPIDEATLGRLANEIRDASPRKHEITFIGWRIFGQTAGPYWATTHFNPDLNVRILNLQ